MIRFRPVEVVYRTDPWHSHDGRVMVGVAVDMSCAIALVAEDLKESGHQLSKTAADQLHFMRQTQSLSGQEDDYEGEFVVVKTAVAVTPYQHEEGQEEVAGIRHAHDRPHESGRSSLAHR